MRATEVKGTALLVVDVQAGIGDAHTTIDNPVLKAEQIIAHHNALLDGFDAGAHSVTVKPTESILF